ncbi:hypothetical protein [Caldimonas thermodepolymerans]|uniref:hypothetical protein n=1 Tax=Caldimonas thermodepolymerans TaxID=215580 RepID=UPI00249013D1|nr:hypothetical protein [Caldimonas thermodepolymerans]
MTRPAPTTPLPAQILDLLAAHYGGPRSAQAEQLRDAVAQLVGLAARQRAMRELIAHDDAVWDRLKVAPMQRKER